MPIGVPFGYEQSAGGGGSGTVTSVDFSAPVQFSVSGNPVTTSGTIALSWATQNANIVLSGPASGGAAAPTFRALVAADIPVLDTSKISTGVFAIVRGGTNSGTALNNNQILVSSAGAIVEAGAMTNGQLLIGSTSAAPVVATLTAGTAITITNAAGAITVTNNGYTTVQNQGTNLTARNTINFVGRGIIADDSASVSRVRVHDPVTLCYIQDEFVGGGGGSGAIGEAGWTFANGTIVYVASEAGRPGILQHQTTATSGIVAGMGLGNNVNGASLVLSDTWDLVFEIRLNTNDTNTTVRIGLTDNSNGTAQPANGVYFEKLDADTSWFGVTRASSTQTRTAAVATIDTSFHRFRVRRVDANTIGFSIDGGTEQTSTTNIPTGAERVWKMITNSAAANKTFDIDYFDMLVTGLAR